MAVHSSRSARESIFGEQRVLDGLGHFGARAAVEETAVAE